MMHQAYSKFAPLLDAPLGDKSSSKWFLGPWGRGDYMKQLQDFKRSKAFAPIESNWEKSCAQHLLRAREQCVLTWIINKSKDQKSFETDMTGGRVFNVDPQAPAPSERSNCEFLSPPRPCASAAAHFKTTFCLA